MTRIGTWPAPGYCQARSTEETSKVVIVVVTVRLASSIGQW
jgi:hypothetical protein